MFSNVAFRDLEASGYAARKKTMSFRFVGEIEDYFTFDFDLAELRDIGRKQVFVRKLIRVSD